VSHDYDDGPDHDFTRSRCLDCGGTFWSDGWNGCPRCHTCNECGEPSTSEVCEECEVQPGVCDTCGDDAPHGEVICDECLEAREKKHE